MGLDPERQEIAETLLAKWEAKKQVNCYRRQLCRVADALGALSKAIESELGGEASHLVVKLERDQTFSTDSVDHAGGRSSTHELPTAKHLSELTNGYRKASQALKKSTEAANSL